MSATEQAYDRIGVGYGAVRTPDPRIAAQIRAALGNSRHVCNVGAGTGAYEPTDAVVVAVEPSRTMVAQRSRESSSLVVRGVAEALPFPDATFDAAMAVLTVHHWPEVDAGLAELRRVAQRCVVLGFDPEESRDYWLVDYLPASWRIEERRTPSLERVVEGLGGARVEPVPIPVDCRDGFLCAYWRRPEAYLEPDVRAGISCLAALDDEQLAPGLERLREDIESGAWAQQHADLLARDEWDWGYRLFVTEGSQ